MGDVTDTSALDFAMVEIPWCTLVMSGTMTPKKMTENIETSLKCIVNDTTHILEHYCQSY